MRKEINIKIYYSKSLYSILLLSLALPSFVFAQEKTWVTVINELMLVIDGLVPIIIGLAILFFIWGIFKYVFTGEKVEKEKAREVMVWGLISLVIIFSVWALVRMIASVFGFQLGGTIDIENHRTRELYGEYLRAPN